MSFWFKWGGILLGALSVFNLIRKYLEVGLSPILKDGIEFYQNVFYPVADVILWVLQGILFFVTLPEIPKDLIVVYFVIGGALGRIFSGKYVIEKLNENYDNKLRLFGTTGILNRTLMLFLWPIPALILIYFWFLIMAQKELPTTDAPGEVALATTMWLQEVVYAILASLALFALNYYSLGYIG